MASPSGTDLQIATDAGFGELVIDESTAYRTSRQFVKGELPYGKSLFARVRHTHPDYGTSAWSNPVSFSIQVPSNIIGVCMDQPGSSKGSFKWIDALGNKVESFDFHNHPTFSGISMAQLDTRAPVTLTKFPLFYVKTAASGPSGTYAQGKKCWWISNQADEGFRPAACFKRSTNNTISSAIHMGTYLGHEELIDGVSVIGSKYGQVVKASTTKADFKTMIHARNGGGGQSGYRMFDIWDLGALRILLLIAKANSDTQTQWGDNSTGKAYPATGETNACACFKGSNPSTDLSDPAGTPPASRQVFMADLWRCYWYHADKITINEGVVSLFDPRTDPLTDTALSFGDAAQSRYTQPVTSGWIRDVLDCPFTLGNDVHDLMELFLPSEVNGDENMGTFSDYHSYNRTPYPILFGTAWSHKRESGLYENNTDSHSDGGHNGGSRISKT